MHEDWPTTYNYIYVSVYYSIIFKETQIAKNTLGKKWRKKPTNNTKY